jgi:hypothetical protein
MGFKNFKIWGVFLVAIVVIAFLLFQQSNTNKLELEGQAIRNIELVKGHFQYAFQSNLDKVLFSLQGRKSQFKGAVEIELVEDGNKVPDISIKNTEFTFPLNNLFVKIDRHQFFEKIFLADTSGKVIFPQSEVGKMLPAFDKVEADPFRLPVIKHEIIYKDEVYLLYFTPVVIENMRFFLAGVIKKSYYDSIGRRVDFTNLTILVFLLALMLFSLPIISLFGLQKGDKLTKFRVYNVGLSLIGIMVMLGFGFSFFKQHHPIDEEIHEKSVLEVREGYSAYLNEKRSTIESWDSDRGGFNELIEIKNDGIVSRLYINNFGLIDDPSFINLNQRAYFLFFGKKFFPGEFEKGKDQVSYIGSHYSLDSAIIESVISKLDYNQNRIEAITFSWDKYQSPFDSIRRYILFKEDGLVIHKSQKIDAPLDNLKEMLSETKWKEITSIMKGNSDNESALEHSWEIPLYLDGHAYEAVLVPVKKRNEFDQPLWMIYLVDGHLEHVFSSLITFETMILLLVYLSILALISFFNKLIKPESKYKQWEKFAYYYLFPNQKKSFEFMVMIGFFVVYSFLFVYFYNQPNFHFFAMYVLIILGTLHTKMLMYIWLGPVWGGPNHRQAVSNILALMLILVFPFWGLFFLVGPGTFWFILIFVALTLVGSIYTRKKINNENKKEERPSYENEKVLPKGQKTLASFHSLYVAFFIMWIFLIGFIPGYVLFSKVYQYEKNHWEATRDNIESVQPNRFWNAYDEARRLIFGSLSTQYEPVISDFIALDKLKVQPDPEAKYERASFGFLGTYYRNISHQPFLFLFVSIVFFTFIVLAFWLVRSLTNKIYFLDFNFDLMDPGVEKSQKYLSQVFICGLDSDLNQEWVIEKFNKKHSDIGVIDAVLNPTIERGGEMVEKIKGKSIWLIQNLHCIDLNEEMIRLLPIIMEEARQQKKILVLSSGISWKEMNKKLVEKSQQIRFSQIFSNFYFEYVPIMGSEDSHDESVPDTVLLTNQRSNKAYFTNIWSELSFNERKVCYYFSLEGFFNFSNKEVIIELIQKGVLVKNEDNEMPKLFSKTFRHFVVSHASQEEIQMFKKDEQKNGNVRTIQIAVFSFILLTVAMISYFDKNFLDQATTFVTGIAGALGGLYSMFSKAIPTLKFGSNE